MTRTAYTGVGVKDHSKLDNLPWSTAGHTIDTDFDLAGNDLLNAGDIGINATIDHKIYNTSDDLYIENLNSNKDIYFRANRAGTSGNLVQLDASDGLMRVSALSGIYGLNGLLNLTGAMTGSSLTGGIGFNPTMTGSFSYFIPVLAQPVMNTNAGVIAFYLAPVIGATNTQNIETIRTVASAHKTGYSDTIKMLTEQSFSRSFFAVGSPDASTIAYNHIVIGGQATIGDFSGGTAPTYVEDMITLTGGLNRPFGTTGSVNQKGIKFVGFGINVGGIAGTDSVYATWTDGGIHHLHDNTYLELGTGTTSGGDSRIYFDATDLVINSDWLAGGTALVKFAAASNWTANGTNTVTISNVAPAGVGTATISKWLTIKDNAGTTMYIPAWT